MLLELCNVAVVTYVHVYIRTYFIDRAILIKHLDACVYEYIVSHRILQGWMSRNIVSAYNLANASYLVVMRKRRNLENIGCRHFS